MDEKLCRYSRVESSSRARRDSKGGATSARLCARFCALEEWGRARVPACSFPNCPRGRRLSPPGAAYFFFAPDLGWWGFSVITRVAGVGEVGCLVFFGKRSDGGRWDGGGET